MEEAFGCCLGTVLAHVHIDSTHSVQSDCCDKGGDSDFGIGKEDWEHVDLFHDPLAPDMQQTAAAAAAEPVQSAQVTCSSPPAIAPPHKPELLASTTRADADAARMAALFRRLRRRLERLRRYNRTARFREAREQAAAILGTAAAGGCQRIASRAARLLGWTGYLTAATLDDLELQIDLFLLLLPTTPPPPSPHS